MKKLIPFLSIALVSFSISFAVAGKTTSYQKAKVKKDSKLSNKHVVKVRSFPLPHQRGEVFVIVRSDGVLHGKPYIVELRPSCNGKGKSWQTLEVKDVQSACRVNLESISLTSDKMSVQVKMQLNDMDYDKKQMELNSGKDTYRCDEEFTETFSLTEICD